MEYPFKIWHMLHAYIYIYFFLTLLVTTLLFFHQTLESVYFIMFQTCFRRMFNSILIYLQALHMTKFWCLMKKQARFKVYEVVALRSWSLRPSLSYQSETKLTNPFISIFSLYPAQAINLKQKLTNPFISIFSLYSAWAINLKQKWANLFISIFRLYPA